MSGPKSVGVGVSIPFVPLIAIVALPGAALYLGAAVLRARAAAKQEQERRRAAIESRGSELLADLAEVDRRWQAAKQDDAGGGWHLADALRDRIQATSDGRLENEAAEAALEEIAEEIAKARRESAAMGVMLQMRSALQEASSRAGTGPNTPAPPQKQEERLLRHDAEQLSRLLRTLVAAVSEEDRNAIDARAEQAMAAPPGRRRTLILQLRSDIQSTNAAARERRRMAQEAERWREKLVGLEGSEVEELDAALLRVVAGDAPLPPNIEQTVTEVYDRAAGDLKRAYALGVVAEELQNLGYVVETGFETASADAPQMLLRKPDMEDDYHVSLEADPGAMLHTRLVRETDGPLGPRSAGRQQQDKQAEEAWCTDLAGALAAAAKRGVRTNVTSRHRAGEIPVQAIAPFDARPKRRRRRRERQLRSRAR